MKSNVLDSDTLTVNLIDWIEMRSNSRLCQVIIEIRSANKRGCSVSISVHGPSTVRISEVRFRVCHGL